MSTKAAPAIGSALALVSVMVSTLGVPAGIVAGAKALATVTFSRTSSVALTPLVSIVAEALRMRDGGLL